MTTVKLLLVKNFRNKTYGPLQSLIENHLNKND
jgi:hypothetical protein